MNKNKGLILLAIISITFLGVYLLKDRPLKTTAAYRFISGKQYHYSFSISQQDYNSQFNSLFGSSSTAKLSLNGKMDLHAISKNEIELKLTEITKESALTVIKNNFPLKKILQGKSCTFLVTEDGTIDDIYFANDEEATIKEIIKNIISLLQWKHSTKPSWISHERLGSNHARVKYLKRSETLFSKRVEQYSYLSSVDLTPANTIQNNIGEINLEIEKNIPTTIAGELETAINNKIDKSEPYHFSLSFKMELLSQSVAPGNVAQIGTAKEKLSNISIKKIGREESLKALAAGLTTKSIGTMILGKSNPKQWFHKAIAQLLLDKKSHTYLNNLFNKTDDHEIQALILDLLTAAGEGRFQKTMLSILNRNHQNQNYLQMVQRLSMLAQPIPMALEYIQNQIKTSKLTKKDIFDRRDASLLYTYGSMAKHFDQKTSDEIFESLNEQLDQHNNADNQDALLIALANTGNPEAAEVASKYIDSSSPKVREASIITLASVSSPLSKSLLLDKVFDEDESVSNRAMMELRKFTFSEDDYQFLAAKLDMPTEKLLGHLISITENQPTKLMKPIIPLLFKLYNEGNYSEGVKRRMHIVIETYNHL